MSLSIPCFNMSSQLCCSPETRPNEVTLEWLSTNLDHVQKELVQVQEDLAKSLQRWEDHESRLARLEGTTLVTPSARDDTEDGPDAIYIQRTEALIIGSTVGKKVSAMEQRLTNLEAQMEGKPNEEGANLASAAITPAATQEITTHASKEQGGLHHDRLKQRAKNPIKKAQSDRSAQSNTSYRTLGKGPTERNMRSYALEENVYGVVVMPGREYCVAAVILVLLYLLIGCVSIFIFQATDREMKSVQSGLTTMCTELNDGNWDCRLDSLKELADFSKLDRDGDGAWSMEEARDEDSELAGILSIFVNLQEVALQMPEFLKFANPVVNSVADLFCSLIWPQYRVGLGPPVWWAPFDKPTSEDLIGKHFKYINITELDKVKEINEDKDPLSDSPSMSCSRTQSSSCCKSMAEVFNEFLNPINGTPPQLVDPCYTAFEKKWCRHYFVGSPPITPRDQFMDQTVQLSRIPKPLYDIMYANLVRPCLLTDADMCSNAELSDILKSVPMWRDLDRGTREVKCKTHIENVCPSILGDAYRTRQTIMTDTCGERKYTDDDMQDSSSFRDEEDAAKCEDQNDRVPRATYEFQASGRAVKEFFENYPDPVDTCADVQALNLADSPLMFKLRRGVSVSVADNYAKACPLTSCTKIP